MVKIGRPDSTYAVRGEPRLDKVTATKAKKGEKPAKVLGICGSPRLRGNTQTMLELALDSCKEAGAETELILLSGKNIKPCDACESCEKTKRCHIKDDMQEIYPKLWKADGIIIGSPTYGMGVSALTRIFLDRTGGLHATWMSGKNGKDGMGFLNTVGGVVVVAGRTGSSLVFSSIIAEFTLDKWIFAGAAFGYGWDKREVLKDDFGKIEAKDLGQRMVRFINLVKKGGW